MARHLTLLGAADTQAVAGIDQPDGTSQGAIVHVAATREDATALLSVVPALRRLTSSPQVLMLAGSDGCEEWGLQELSDSVTALRTLPVEAGSDAVQTARALTAGELCLADIEPFVVVVPGSTSAALGCALAAVKLGIPVARLEAGVREHDWRAPEEVNRVLMDTMADTLFAPSYEAEGNLAREGVQESRVHMTGSTVVATAVARADEAQRRAVWALHGMARGGYAYVALGRPSSADHDERLARIVEAVAALALRVPVTLSLHPVARQRLQPMGDEHRLREAGVLSLPPLPYTDHLSLVAGAGAIVTDSGSAQEEASALGVPCFTLGAVTARGMTLTHGTNTLLGADPRDLTAVRLEPRPLGPGFFARWHTGAGERVATELTANYALVRLTSAS